MILNRYEMLRIMDTMRPYWLREQGIYRYAVDAIFPAVRKTPSGNYAEGYRRLPALGLHSFFQCKKGGRPFIDAMLSEFYFKRRPVSTFSFDNGICFIFVAIAIMVYCSVQNISIDE